MEHVKWLFFILVAAAVAAAVLVCGVWCADNTAPEVEIVVETVEIEADGTVNEQVSAPVKGEEQPVKIENGGKSEI